MELEIILKSLNKIINADTIMEPSLMDNKLNFNHKTSMSRNTGKIPSDMFAKQRFNLACAFGQSD